MLPASLPFDYVMLIDRGDRLRMATERATGSRIRRIRSGRER